jgi:D-glycero-D-manno-heptose 1,7-bisphosphate phosphatase
MRLLLLDRDGVINEDSADFVKSPAEWIPIPGSIRAIARANALGFKVVVVSNQSGLARGLFDIEQLNRIHRHMLDEVERDGGHIEAIFFCPHLPADDCRCRKPKTYLLEDIASRLAIDLHRAYLVGDRSADIDAALALGIHPILVRTGHGEAHAPAFEANPDVHVCADLNAAVAWLRHRD